MARVYEEERTVKRCPKCDSKLEAFSPTTHVFGGLLGGTSTITEKVGVCTNNKCEDFAVLKLESLLN